MISLLQRPGVNEKTTRRGGTIDLGMPYVILVSHWEEASDQVINQTMTTSA
jgi:hypothetical protein